MARSRVIRPDPSIHSALARSSYEETALRASSTSTMTMKMKRVASISPRAVIALLILSTRQSAVLARSIPYFYSGAKDHRSAFTSSLRQKIHQSNVLQRRVFRRSRIAPLSASPDGDNENNFFGAEDVKEVGNFFEDEQRSPSQKNEEEGPITLEELEMLATPFDEHLPKINTVTLVGRVGNDPEPRYFDDGKVVLNLSLAVKRKYHPLERKVRNIRSGDEETDWFALEFWGRDAEYVTNYVEKGARLGVTGSLVVDGWVDKMTGEQRRKPKIIVRHTDILESRAEAELRKGNKGNYNVDSGGGKKYDEDEDGAPSPAGTGGFFS